MADDAGSYQHSKSGSKTVLVKVAEVIIAIIAISLIVTPLNSFQQIFTRPRIALQDIAIIYIALGGYLIINVLFIIAHFLGDRVPKRTLIMFAAVGAILHVIAASINVHNWRKIHSPYYRAMNDETYGSKLYMDMMISSAVFTFINAAVFAAEVFVTVRFS